jgi:hypothetical protein
VADDDLTKRIKEHVQPELDRMQADHDRFMRLLAKMPEPSEIQKRAIAEANSPEGWQRALDEVIAEVQRPKRKAALIGLLSLLALAVLTAIFLGSLR